MTFPTSLEDDIWENPRIDDWMRNQPSGSLRVSFYILVASIAWFQLLEFSNPSRSLHKWHNPLTMSLSSPSLYCHPAFCGKFKAIFLPSNHWNITWEIQVIKDLVQGLQFVSTETFFSKEIHPLLSGVTTFLLDKARHVFCTVPVSY